MAAWLTEIKKDERIARNLLRSKEVRHANRNYHRRVDHPGHFYRIRFDLGLDRFSDWKKSMSEHLRSRRADENS